MGTRRPIDAFGWAPDRAGIFVDFDGVLADISPDPEAATIRPGLGELLLELHERLGRVAVISGRPVAFLDAMVPPAIDVVGLYGLEWRRGGMHHTLREAEQYRSVIRDLAERAAAELRAELVEPKGLSLTVHYRNHPEMADAVKRWVAEQAELTGLEPRAAKASFELHPPIARDKGTVLLELAEDLDPVAYIGDDIGDLAAFDGLDELARHGVATVRVAADSDESPPILRRRADVVVDGPAGAEALLREILEAAASAPGSR